MAETSSSLIAKHLLLILLTLLHSTSGNDFPQKKSENGIPFTPKHLRTFPTGEESMLVKEATVSKNHNGIPFINKTESSKFKKPAKSIDEVTIVSFEYDEKNVVPKPGEYPIEPKSTKLASDSMSVYSVSSPFGFGGHPLLTNRTQERGYKAHKNFNTGNQPSARAVAYPETHRSSSVNANAIKSNNYPPYGLRSFDSGWNASLNNDRSRSGDEQGANNSGGDFRMYREIVKQILIRALAGMVYGNASGKSVPCKSNSQPCLRQVANDVLASQARLYDQNLQTTSNSTTNSYDKYSKLKKMLATPKRLSRRRHGKTRRNASSISSTRSIKGDMSENSMSMRRPSFRLAVRSSGTDGVNGNNNNNNDNQGGSGVSTSPNSYPSSSRANAPVDQSVFSQFASETMSFERQSASEITRLDNLLRQLALAAQTDFSSVSASVSAVQQQLLQTQQQLVQAWNLLNDTHSKDNENTLSELHGVKTDVYRLHALMAGTTPLGQPTAQGRVAEVREETRAGVDCAALAKYGANSSGVYDLQPDPSNNQSRMTAFCDMDTNGGGWTVFQRRKDGSDDFFRGWNSYKHGFGSYHHDHWLGLENIHLLTKYGDNVMRIELTDWENETRWAEFSYTRIMGESDGYRILVGGYRGTAGDPFHSLSYDMRMQSMRFSTFDSDNDMDNGGNCALTFTSGWWFNKCFQINLNGVWYGSSRYAGPSMNGIVWDLWPEHFNGYSLKQTEMKLRPANFLTTK